MLKPSLRSFLRWSVFITVSLCTFSSVKASPLETCRTIEGLVQQEKWKEAQVAIEECRTKVLFEHSRRFEKLFPESVLTYRLEQRTPTGESFGHLGGLLNLNREYRSPGLPSVSISIESGENRMVASVICDMNLRIPAEDSLLFGYRARHKVGKNASPMTVICLDDASVIISSKDSTAQQLHEFASGLGQKFFSDVAEISKKP